VVRAQVEAVPLDELRVSITPVTQEEHVKSREEIMFILEAFDLTRSYRDAAELAGCDHHTVAHYVGAREEGRLSAMAAPRSSIVDPTSTRSRSGWSAPGGKVRADVAHDKLVALGYTGSERTSRRRWPR